MNWVGEKGLSKEQIKSCIHVLESLLENRLDLNLLSPDERTALMMAAGKLSRPDKLSLMKYSKAHRKIKKRKERRSDDLAKNQTMIRQQRESDTFVPLPKLASGKTQYLKEPQACYVCKTPYTELHFFYDSMCPECAGLNYEKRFQTADLRGQTALLTGSRVKIGFQTGLKLLRAGAHLIATTRFPKDAAFRYAKEKDFSDWKDRLHIYGLDLRHAPSVEILAGFLNRNYSQLEIIVNNAAQTVRRPPGFYRHLMDRESGNLPKELQPLLEPYEACKRQLSGELKNTEATALITGSAFQKAAIGIQDSASLSLIPYAYDEDTNAGLEVFPLGESDADDQQLDLRSMNSWRLRLGDVPTPEMLEVHLVNAVAPFILCGRLKPLLLKSEHTQKHIVNVSAMEGKFTRYTKTDKHPHTNMAKAALNMMTATSAKDYVKDKIYMNAVDTGWVTDEDPAIFATRKKEELNFQPPLDIVDGAARNCDPIFSGHLTSPVFGKFLKDYKPTEW